MIKRDKPILNCDISCRKSIGFCVVLTAIMDLVSYHTNETLSRVHLRQHETEHQLQFSIFSQEKSFDDSLEDYMEAGE